MMMNGSRKRSIVYAVRDYPLGCGNSDHPLVAPPRPYGTRHKQETEFRNYADHRHHDALAAPKETNLKKAGFKISDLHDCDVAAAAPTRKRTCLNQESSFRNSLHDRVLAAPRFKEASFRSSDQHVVLAAPPKPQGSRLKQEPADRNSHQGPVVAAAPKLKGACFKQEAASRSSDQQDLTPREQVLEVLRHFKDVFRQLDRDKQTRRLDGDLFDATARIDIRALAVLEKMGKQVNTEKRIGLVPGINVGDEFQYKTELCLVGLHFKTMCGIDYMNVGDVKLATSIVASEGYGYSDKFGAGVVVYTGEGGNVVSKEKKTEDQRLVKGNLALANSMRKKSLVRVIRGEERMDKKGKRYVYDGLYLVDKYWLEKEVRGTTVYKFKLCRVPGQPLCC